MQRGFDSLPPPAWRHNLWVLKLTLCRWKYLEAGVSKIMSNLQEGMDMNTVSALLLYFALSFC
jgi:hypothetical protein